MFNKVYLKRIITTTEMMSVSIRLSSNNLLMGD